MECFPSIHIWDTIIMIYYLQLILYRAVFLLFFGLVCVWRGKSLESIKIVYWVTCDKRLLPQGTQKTPNDWQFFSSEITNLFFPTLAAVLHGTYPVPGFFVGALVAGDRTEDALLVLQPCEPFLLTEEKKPVSVSTYSVQVAKLAKS